jgi:hypothetical protein
MKLVLMYCITVSTTLTFEEQIVNLNQRIGFMQISNPQKHLIGENIRSEFFIKVQINVTAVVV